MTAAPVVGIMQGRLLPPEGGVIQAFPRRWREEFALAQAAGIGCIEWIYEAGTDVVNPLRTDEGIEQIRRLVREHGVDVRSICADYYMTHQLLDDAGAPSEDAVAHLEWLIGRAAALHAEYIVLPFVDASSLSVQADHTALVDVLSHALRAATVAGVELHLETDLGAEAVLAIVNAVGHPLIRVNFDIGNSAALRLDPQHEVSLLGPTIGSVHVKDRVAGGGTVPLGSGSADFNRVFALLRTSYRRPYILQTARVAGMSEVDHAIADRAFVLSHLTSH
jgi:L-ribulose-5-phosphate 3-epimerase